MLVMAACKTFPYLIAEPAAVEPKTSLSSTEWSLALPGYRFG